MCAALATIILTAKDWPVRCLLHTRLAMLMQTGRETHLHGHSDTSAGALFHVNASFAAKPVVSGIIAIC